MAYTFLNGYSFSLRLTRSYSKIPVYYFEIVEWSSVKPPHSRSCWTLSRFHYDVSERCFDYAHIGRRPHESLDGIDAYFEFYKRCDDFLQSLGVDKYLSLDECIQELYPEALL